MERHLLDPSGPVVWLLLMGRGKVTVEPHRADPTDYQAGVEHFVALSVELALPATVRVPAVRSGDLWQRNARLHVSVGVVHPALPHHPVEVVSAFDDEHLTIVMTADEITVTREVAR